MAISKIGVQATGFADANVGLPIPNISLENRAAEAANGTIFFNTSNNEIEVYANGAWTSVGVTPKIPVITSLSGNVYRTAATTLTASVSNATPSTQLIVSNSSTIIATINPSTSSLVAGEGTIDYVMSSGVYNQTSNTSLTFKLYEGSTDTLGISTQTKSVEVARSCKQLLDFGLVTENAVYEITNYGTIAAENHYCLQDSSYNGGGWTLLLTMTNGNSNFGGSNNPFVDPGSVGTPSLSNVYTRNRGNTFQPAANDQFMLRRESNADWVRFEISGWVAGSSWETLTEGHNDLANGQAYSAAGSSLSGFTNFNCCTKGGNCGSGGGDGCGFGTFNSWCDNSSSGTSYGFGFNGATNGGSPMCWGVQNTFITDVITTWFRKNGTQ